MLLRVLHASNDVSVVSCRRLPLDKQVAALNVPYDVFRHESRYNSQQRRAALERVAMTMLRGVKTIALQEFFVAHVCDVMAVIEAKTTKVCGENAQTSYCASSLYV